MERTMVIITPDGFKQGVVGQIISSFEKKGYKLIAMKIQKPEQNQFEEHFSQHKEQVFFKPLVQFMVSGPVCVMAWEGNSVIATGNKFAENMNEVNSKA